MSRRPPGNLPRGDDTRGVRTRRSGDVVPPTPPRRGLPGGRRGRARAGALTLPAEIGITAGLLAAVCALLFVAAVVVFLAVPGPGTLSTLLGSVPLAGSVLVVAVLLLLSTADRPFRWIWLLVGAGAAVWATGAAWRARSAGREPGD